MESIVPEEGRDEYIAIIAVACCTAICWLELIQTMRIYFDDNECLSIFVGDKPTLRALIEQMAACRHLTIELD